MADDASKPAEEKSLEARVAELEDRLSKVHITEDEMKAYHKVSSLLATGGVAAAAAGAQAGAVDECGVNECNVIRQPIGIVRQCVISQCIITQCIIRQPIIRQCTYECYECGGQIGGVNAGGFGTLGG